MKRGDVWSAATGSGFGSKPRPVIVVQGNIYTDTPNVLVALCTTALSPPDEVRPRVVPDEVNSLNEVSDVAVDLLVAVPRHKFGRRIGQLSEPDLGRVDLALLAILGFAD